MCDNIGVIYFFMFLKIVVLLILPIIIIKIKKDYSKILIIVDIILLLILFVCNTFTINKCIYNSTFMGVQNIKNKNIIQNYLKMHPTNNSIRKIESNKNYKMYGNKELHYYNLNRSDLSNIYYECNGEKVYFNSIGSAFAAYSTAISSLYGNDVDPIEVYNLYKNNIKDICDREITIEDIHNSVMKSYGAIKLERINSYQVEASIKSGALVIAHISANKNSKLTCDNNFIVIYNIGLDGKYSIADSMLKNKTYTCPYSSAAYGKVISNDNMNNTWSLDDINSETISYYMVKKG